MSEAPAITLPAPTPAAQPTIVLPAAPAASTAAPVVQQVPAAAPAATVADEPAPERSTKPRAAAKAAAPAAARSVSAARTAAPETPPATPIAAPAQRAADAMPPVAAPPLAQPAVTQPPVAAVSPTESDTSTGLSTAAWIAGILAALGIGTAGVLALRSRRRDEEEDYEEAYYEDAHAADPARFYDEPGPMMAPAMAASEPSVLEPELPMPAYAPAEEMAAEATPKAIEPTPHPSVAQRIGTEELVPDNREDRDALLEQMVSAEPDAENPFTSRKGRMRRARLILQGREHKQKEAEVQPFDWRTYQSSTSNPAPATPPAGHGLKVRVPSPSQEGMG
ncbi:hypothetical protein KRR38_20885 [Novosphingobium sp. G106]|uniref:hypothetical protein n=1 Tax=Novosphingobium sp. G106 TaxID=2849500 RepID=UPI001C2D45EF|nr:hypothetical protein [Novosphingobium sp. G106]MBV1690070.1 hypothetical protein [Novosphingobium sp. G106]